MPKSLCAWQRKIVSRLLIGKQLDKEFLDALFAGYTLDEQDLKDFLRELAEKAKDAHVITDDAAPVSPAT